MFCKQCLVIWFYFVYLQWRRNNGVRASMVLHAGYIWFQCSLYSLAVCQWIYCRIKKKYLKIIWAIININICTFTRNQIQRKIMKLALFLYWNFKWLFLVLVKFLVPTQIYHIQDHGHLQKKQVPFNSCNILIKYYELLWICQKQFNSVLA